MPGPLQIALVVLLILVLFGRGKISELMGDVAKGITSFRKGLKEDDSDATVDVTPTLDAKAAPAAEAEKAPVDEAKS